MNKSSKQFIDCVTKYFGLVLISKIARFRAKMMWLEFHFYALILLSSKLVSFLDSTWQQDGTNMVVIAMTSLLSDPKWGKQTNKLSFLNVPGKAPFFE